MHSINLPLKGEKERVLKGGFLSKEEEIKEGKENRVILNLFHELL